VAAKALKQQGTNLQQLPRRQQPQQPICVYVLRLRQLQMAGTIAYVSVVIAAVTIIRGLVVRRPPLRG
jgi:hypothetical protein